ncbi:hypothetical protein EJ08DRAFT_209128 [Tothia fuscella]|uniref:Fungal N-terminal domain-containing protein n=1 Tax=Tothia fuscella TaxID=1048955 RepID=A0A9P4TZC4_9PEZI|nr:hypothetical protein EJ08DRAFT_209128 [Tothia fuscella]
MDPASVIGVLSAAGGIVALIINTAKKLQELRERYKESDVTIRLLMSELLTVRAALTQVDEYAKHNLTPTSPVQEDLRSAFDISIEGCMTALELLADEVDGLLGNDNGEAFQKRVKQLWKDSMMKIHQQRLHTQVGALQLLLQAIQIQSLSGQAAVLREPKHQKLLEQVRDDTSSLRPVLLTIRSRSRPSSLFTRTESIVGSTVFPFDREITSSGVYQRNGLEALGKREEQIALTRRDRVDTWQKPDATRQLINREETLSPTSTNSASADTSPWQKPQSFEKPMASLPSRDRQTTRPTLTQSSLSERAMPKRGLTISKNGLRSIFRSNRSSQSTPQLFLSSNRALQI